MDSHLPAEATFRFLEYPWLTVQSVCRHWRHVALHTPVLWSYIHASFQQGRFLERQKEFVSTSLRRSGTVPLTIYLKGDPGAGFYYEDVVFSDLFSQANSERIRELRMRRFQTGFLAQLGENHASQLEVLVVDDPVEDEGNFNYNLPKLRTLIASFPEVGLDTVMLCNVHALRHLVILGQWFTSDTLLSLHTLLASNPQLEDLVIIDICGAEELSIELDQLPSLGMPELRRLEVGSVREGSSSVAQELVEKKLTLPESHAKFYRLRKYPNFSPLRKLFVGNTEDIITTDGRTSLLMTGDWTFSRDESQYAQLDEVWLWFNWRQSMDAPESKWTLGLGAAKEVKKVVLVRGITSWLQYFSRHRLFPALAELQLHTQEHQDGPAILEFLATRAQDRPIQTLRFVQDPRKGGKIEAFSSWKDKASKFTQFVPHVIFEHPDHPPLRMELPALCTTASTAHSYWPSWEMWM
ncbi:hypothetical protein BC835DRAFT_875566 [Cytidiella melzeri]|nr:hypothetical protein BC835DRAFT_875566 [Cytidiella melzeri]